MEGLSCLTGHTSKRPAKPRRSFSGGVPTGGYTNPLDVNAHRVLTSDHS